MNARVKDIPLVLAAFNRPDLLRRQLEMVRANHAGQIFAIVDGARAGNAEDARNRTEVIRLFQELQSEFDLRLDQSDTNLGCYSRIKSGLDWVFNETDKAIVLENDCMPDKPSLLC